MFSRLKLKQTFARPILLAVKNVELFDDSGNLTKMKKKYFDFQHGYSLIETMIVLVIAAIIITFAVAGFGSSQTQFNRQNIARELKVSLERARFDSVKRRAVNTADLAEVKILSATSFSVKTDINQNGMLDASETRTINFNGQNGVRLVGNSLVFPITINFDRYGRITAKDGTSPTPQNITPIFTICTNNCTAANATASNADVIYVSPSGTVAMLVGGSSQPTFQSPNVSNVNVNSNLNPDIRLAP